VGVQFLPITINKVTVQAAVISPFDGPALRQKVYGHSVHDPQTAVPSSIYGELEEHYNLEKLPLFYPVPRDSGELHCRRKSAF